MTYLVAIEVNDEFDSIENMFDNMEDALVNYMELEEDGKSPIIYEEN